MAEPETVVELDFFNLNLEGESARIDELMASRTIAIYDPEDNVLGPDQLLVTILESIKRADEQGQNFLILAPYSYTPEGVQEIETAQQARENFDRVALGSLSNADTFDHLTMGAVPLSCHASFDAGVLAGFYQSDAEVEIPFSIAEMRDAVEGCISGGKDVENDVAFWGGVFEGIEYKQSLVPRL